MKPIRRWLVTVLLAGSVAAPAAGHEMAAKAGSDGRCDGPEFSCAMTATPVFARDGALWLAWNSASRVVCARSPG
ncbi:MAG: hypothetical protein R3F24_09320 [Gammaproteobacteria bacterium]